MCGYVPGLTGPTGDEVARTGGVAGDGGEALVAGHALPAELSSDSPAERVIDAHELGEHVLLAIDTALGTSVAVGANGRVVEVVSDDPRGHSEMIGTLIARALELAEVPASAVTGVVAGVGPGPFTGLRVGIAAAHAFATGRGVPLLPLQGHEAVALAVLGQGAAAEVRVVQDAKRRELFVSQYSRLGWSGVPVRSVDPHLVTRAAFVDSTADVWPERIPAARLVQLAARRLHSHGEFEPDQALYLRAPDVKPSTGPKRVTP